MARIAGVNIPTAKRIEVALTYIYGIGRKTAQDICAKSGVSVDRRVHELSDEEVAKIREVIDNDVVVEGELRREPCSGCNSYLVTLGPWLISVMLTRTPKVLSVCCKRIAVSFNSRVLSLPCPLPLFNLDNGGKTYFLGAFFCVF